MPDPREVVITGLGIVSPIGVGREAFEKSLRDQTSGVAAITHYDAQHLPVRIGAELKDFQPKLYVKPRKSLKVMSREIQMGVASATLAMEDAKLDAANVDPERLGVVYGSPMLYADNPELTISKQRRPKYWNIFQQSRLFHIDVRCSALSAYYLDSRKCV